MGEPTLEMIEQEWNNSLTERAESERKTMLKTLERELCFRNISRIQKMSNRHLGLVVALSGNNPKREAIGLRNVLKMNEETLAIVLIMPHNVIEFFGGERLRKMPVEELQAILNNRNLEELQGKYPEIPVKTKRGLFS